MGKIDKKILIVEDDKDLLLILRSKFVEEGFSVATAGNGEEGIRLAEKENPDLIVSDLIMPKLDGMEMAKKIKESKNNAIIIFLTNKEDDGLDGIGKSKDFEYLIKSKLKIDDIIKKIKKRLRVN